MLIFEDDISHTCIVPRKGTIIHPVESAGNGLYDIERGQPKNGARDIS